MDDVGEQATGARTALTIIVARKNYVPSGEFLPSITWALYFLMQRRASLLTANSLLHLILIYLLSIVTDSYCIRKQSPIVLVVPYFFIIRRISVDTTAP
jgi:hypothetical protein